MSEEASQGTLELGLTQPVEVRHPEDEENSPDVEALGFGAEEKGKVTLCCGLFQGLGEGLA